ncbi:MAG TPA: hypothetical protein VH333_18605 [Pseudonocardiaceae bacterium]|jgi:hypothetical protein|nr:hypothetical protein [Pseudonocardiaceae bacterium]
MPEGFVVDHQSLDQHSQDIDQIMDQISEATGDAGSLWDPQAFGIIGESWAGILSIWTTSADKAIKTAVAGGKKVSDNVKSMNENYKNNEQNVAQSFNAISSGTGEN